MKIQEKFFKKLLVEGNDDQHVIWALCEKNKLKENFDVIDCGGIEKLNNEIEVRLKSTDILDFDTLGIIIDADSDINKRWSTLKKMLIQKGFNLTNELPPSGLVYKNAEEVKIGIWIMPNNNLNGMLEDFIRFLVPKNDLLLPIANETLEQIEKQNLNQYNTIHKSKTLIHTWLAWQEDPGTPMGLSITKKYLTTDEETCNKFVNWLKELFKPEETF